MLEAAFIFAAFYVVLAIPAIATFLKRSIKPQTIATSMVLGILSLAVFVIIDLANDNISPLISIKVMLGSAVGLVLGGMITKWRDYQQA
jgi:drug/metabolite transporter (DMT)-like permease